MDRKSVDVAREAREGGDPRRPPGTGRCGVEQPVPVVFVALKEQVADQALVVRDLGGRRPGPVRQTLAELLAESLEQPAQLRQVRPGDGEVGVGMPDHPGVDELRAEGAPFQIHSLGQERVAVGEGGNGSDDDALAVVQQAHDAPRAAPARCWARTLRVAPPAVHFVRHASTGV